MKLYKKQCRPYRVSFGGQGFCDEWVPLMDWQDEEKEEAIRAECLEKFNFRFSELKFQYRYQVVATL